MHDTEKIIFDLYTDTVRNQWEITQMHSLKNIIVSNSDTENKKN